MKTKVVKYIVAWRRINTKNSFVMDLKFDTLAEAEEHLPKMNPNFECKIVKREYKK